MQLSRDFRPELDALRRELGADFAIISHIDGAQYTVLQVASKTDAIKAGDVFATNATYCDEVVRTRQMVSYPHVGNIPAMRLHPIYTAMQLDAYLGVPLYDDGEVIGTLNFTAFEPRNPDLTAEQICASAALASKIEDAVRIERATGTR